MKTDSVQRTVATIAAVTSAFLLAACQERSVQQGSVQTAQDSGGSPAVPSRGYIVDPALVFVEPEGLETNRGPNTGIHLGFSGVPEGYPIFDEDMPVDWAGRLKRVLRVTQTDTETDLPYGLEKKVGRPEKIRVKPERAIEAGKGYRVTMDLSKGGRPFPKVKVLDAYHREVVCGNVSVEFYTYSRPMLQRVQWSENSHLLDFVFTEGLRVDSILENPRAKLAVDGVEVNVCTDPYERNCLDRPIGHGPYTVDGELVELTGGILYAFSDSFGPFSEMTLRLPHAIRGLEASLLDGDPNNRVATLDGDYIVYAIKFADMRETQPGLWEWKY
ncbi:MAG: hypothetical protein HY897_22725 [Deltaproteobacteria bacterium]|nr:hypothetical protein [Deltaproteobacteria bacterium]